MNKEQLLLELNGRKAEQRLAALQQLRDSGYLNRPGKNESYIVNNHIHTCYSFSPYSPSLAVVKAYEAGLAAAGIVDHDSLAGAKEFIAAGQLLDMATTVGFELRSDHSMTQLGKRKTNNPDQAGISYLTFHGVPHQKIDEVMSFFEPISKAREKRNRLMLAKINEIFALSLDYDQDVLPLSKHHEGGSVTERHLLYALADKLKTMYGEGLVAYLNDYLSITPSIKAQLSDHDNPYYDYDLLGLLKSELVERFYLPADREECPPLPQLVDFAWTNGIILAYPYLGDVGVSVTGDKKPQLFEDSYLDELFAILAAVGIKAVSYMPSRNTKQQLKRVRDLCEQYNFFQISGEDINSPRQSFVCEALADPVFSNLIANTWALIAHEAVASQDLAKSFIYSDLPLKEKVSFYQELVFPGNSQK